MAVAVPPPALSGELDIEGSTKEPTANAICPGTRGTCLWVLLKCRTIRHRTACSPTQEETWRPGISVGNTETYHQRARMNLDDALCKRPCSLASDQTEPRHLNNRKVSPKPILESPRPIKVAMALHGINSVVHGGVPCVEAYRLSSTWSWCNHISIAALSCIMHVIVNSRVRQSFILRYSLIDCRLTLGTTHWEAELVVQDSGMQLRQATPWLPLTVNLNEVRLVILVCGRRVTKF